MTDGAGEEFEVVVAELADLTEGVRGLTLARPDGSQLPPWAPGAHVDALLQPGLERQYSLCGDPADRGRWRIGVLREPDGRGGSAYVHDQLRAGDRLRLRGPRNHFPLADARAYLFIAGGIGITPLLPMLRAVSAAGAAWRLVYGGRSEASMAYLEELRQYGDQVLVWPQDRCGLIDLDGLRAATDADAAVYCCGPEPLIAAVEERWPEPSVHVERFRPRAFTGPDHRTTFEVHLDYSELTVTVTPEQSIVEALEAVGIEVVTSCREGTCGTCETPVLEGIPEHRDSLLTPAERAANDTMMICCSRSLTPRLVLDL